MRCLLHRTGSILTNEDQCFNKYSSFALWLLADCSCWLRNLVSQNMACPSGRYFRNLKSGLNLYCVSHAQSLFEIGKCKVSPDWICAIFASSQYKFLNKLWRHQTYPIRRYILYTYWFQINSCTCSCSFKFLRQVLLLIFAFTLAKVSY